MTPELLARLRQAQSGKRPVVLATRLPGGEQKLLPEDNASPELREAAKHALRAAASGTVKVGDETWCSYWATMFTRSRKTALMASCHDQSESG